MASGLASADIGVEEGSSTAPGLSLQLIGSGSTYQDFSWTTDVSASFGAINQDMVFSEYARYPECGVELLRVSE